MIKKLLFTYGLIFFFALPLSAQTDPPELGSWMRNTTGLTGYNDLPANVQLVRYSADTVYVSCSSIPAYSIGPWPGDPNIPGNQNHVFAIPRNPRPAPDSSTPTSLGPIGVWVNGVSMFNAKDANSYNNQNVWHSNAVVVEASSFDACLGHPAPPPPGSNNGEYHHHQNPRCLYVADAGKHSPLLGYAFDGYPIYGPYGHADTSASSPIVRLRSGYRFRNITTRTNGPDVSATYPLGYYVEDFEYADGIGDLDIHNGHYTVTPEYPNGTYAYVVTIDSAGASAYPYTIGPTYYGVVANDNISQHGHVAITEQVSTYNPQDAVGERSNIPPNALTLSENYPNPFAATTTIEYTLPNAEYVTLNVYNTVGEQVAMLVNDEQNTGTHSVVFSGEGIKNGLYYYRLIAGRYSQTGKMIVIK